MKNILRKYLILSLGAILMFTSCSDLVNNPLENQNFTESIDYANSKDMIQPLIGAYASFQSRGWEQYPLISLRGDDVSHGGLGDQQPFADTDFYNYDKGYWMYNSLWQTYYSDIFKINTAIEEIGKYRDAGGNPILAEQYIAECKVMRSFLLFQLSRVWGKVFIPTGSKPEELLTATSVPTKDEVMEFIAKDMDDVESKLPDLHPNKRTDVPGGITKFTALAMKALSSQELKQYQKVADATSKIIASGKYALHTDFYQLFKVPGKLSNENLLEFQFSDFKTGVGASSNYLWAFFGPQSWTPAVATANGGWGFYEPTLKYIKFMLDRGETVRLETSVIFTQAGIDELKKDPKYASLPAFVTNTTRDGDRFNNYPRAKFASGKFYLPSKQLIPGRTDYGSNKNLTCIRYAEILLMHAEAIKQGANSTVITADQAVNLVRSRAGLTPLTNVTLDQVINEKYAELATEWGSRYYDLVRLGKSNELTHEGRTFSAEKTFLPYPTAQVDLLPILKNP